MADSYSRHLKFERITNFRDIGGYPAGDGCSVAWRRVFRSGELSRMNDNDLARLTGEIALKSVIDLRSESETDRHGTDYLSDIGATYFHVPFMTGDVNRDEDERLFRTLSNMGEFYLHLVARDDFGGHIVEALEIIADPSNHPLVFHCAIGKDRTGILAAVLLNLLGVADDVIIEDYSLSEPYMDELLARADDNKEIAEAIEHLPDFFWKASPESMILFLSALRREHGSIKEYLESHGAEESLVSRLEDALLS